MSYDEFLRIDVSTFMAIAKTYADDEESHRREEWERMRLLATIVIQPHVKDKITAEQLLPFPWEKKRNSTARRKMSVAEQKKRMQQLLEQTK